MKPLYFLLVPLILFVLYKRISLVIADIKGGNKSKLKVDILFLVLSLVIICFLIWLIEFA